MVGLATRMRWRSESRPSPLRYFLLSRRPGRVQVKKLRSRRTHGGLRALRACCCAVRHQCGLGVYGCCGLAGPDSTGGGTQFLRTPPFGHSPADQSGGALPSGSPVHSLLRTGRWLLPGESRWPGRSHRVAYLVMVDVRSSKAEQAVAIVSRRDYMRWPLSGSA